MSKDTVYLLSMTYASSERPKGGCIYVGEHSERPVYLMGEAIAFSTENEAHEYCNTNNLMFQVTPINKKRYFKAKLEKK